MSETRHYQGTLTLLPANIGETLEQQCQRLYGKEKPVWAASYEEALLDWRYQEFIVRDGELYGVDMRELDNDDSFFHIRKVSDSEYKFEVRYYDGGCSFDEAIEDAFDNIEEV